MRVAALTAARAVLLAGPTALAFFTGGYFDEARAWAGLGAWLLVVVAMLAQPRALPRARVAWLALGGLAALAGWTLLSTTWALIAGNAYHAGQLVILYLGGLLAAASLLRTRPSLRAVEPALAAGTLIVIGYGLSERLLPGLLHFSASVSAQGRLEQPLTYWNAMGELAAIGAVLCVRMMGDVSRDKLTRTLAAAAVVPLGLGLYLSFSRGALFAGAAGLLTLVVAAPRREQLDAVLLSIVAGALVAVSSSQFGGVTGLHGSASTRELQGAITFAVLALIMLATVLAQRWLMSRSPARSGALQLPRRAPLIALVVICAGLAAAITLGAKEGSPRQLSSGASRLATFQSDRYAYWRVAFHAFKDEPFRGIGAGSWSVYWLKYRPIGGASQDAHSLPLQTLAELGIVGLALLAVFLTGIGLAARNAYRAAPVLAAGPLAGFVVYAAHAPLDWDWQMPAVTLVALVLAGALLALAEPEAEALEARTPQSAADRPVDARAAAGDERVTV
jgi:O-Antigen ligase